MMAINGSAFQIVVGETRIKALASHMIEKSQAFYILPLPDDEYQITFKRENRKLVEDFLEG